MNFKTDRLGLLLDQFESSCGLTDEEYRWEPAPGCWAVRRRSEAATPMPLGGGKWVLDFARPEPQPAPVTTIGWRLGHLFLGFSLRWEWTFGERRKLEDAIEFAPSADGALEPFWALMDRWRQSVGAMTNEQLDMIGFGQFPRGLDPQLPFIAIVWWTNRELIHHTAEIGLLRDIWAARESTQ